MVFPTLCRLDLVQSISILRFACCFSFIEHSVSKQSRPRSDVTFCGVWTGSALFGYVPQKGWLIQVNTENKSELPNSVFKILLVFVFNIPPIAKSRAA